MEIEKEVRDVKDGRLFKHLELFLKKRIERKGEGNIQRAYSKTFQNSWKTWVLK
jgi:hypothetical protein